MQPQPCYKFHVGCCGHKRWEIISEDSDELNTLRVSGCLDCPLEWMTVVPATGTDEFTYVKYLLFLERRAAKRG